MRPASAAALPGITPDPEWEAKLESVSNKFRELNEKARQAAAPTPAVQAPGQG